MGTMLGVGRDRQVKVLRIATERVEAAQVSSIVPDRSRPTVRRTTWAIDTLMEAGDPEPN
jgi:hypothetical protein